MQYQILNREDTAFPKSLGELIKPPLRLYYLGDITLLGQLSVAVVGTRKATHYGTRVTREFVRCWAHAGIVIVSGLAYGIDACAHTACMDEGGKTIAVLASGIERPEDAQPHGNYALAKRILDTGGLIVSEHPPEAAVYKHSFLERNRLIAGMTVATVVIEAARKSGALSTAYHALEQGKEVAAVPGSIFSIYSQGTHALIQEGALALTKPELLFDALGIRAVASRDVAESKAKSTAREDGGPLSNEAMVLSIISAGECTLDHLHDISHLKTRDLMRVLTRLEVRGAVVVQGSRVWLK